MGERNTKDRIGEEEEREEVKKHVTSYLTREIGRGWRRGKKAWLGDPALPEDLGRFGVRGKGGDS